MEMEVYIMEYGILAEAVMLTNEGMQYDFNYE